MALLHKSELAYLTWRPSIIWLCPPSQIICPTAPPPTMHVTLSKHCCFRNTANILLIWSTFPRSPNVLPHLSGWCCRAISFSKASWISPFPSSHLWNSSSGPVLPLVPSAFSLQTSQVPGFPSHLPHTAYNKSGGPNCHSAVKLVDWQKVTGISNSASLPPTQRLLG